MSRYENPKFEIIRVSEEDILTASPGVETPKFDENDGIWDLDHNN